jgi:nucleoside-diphosphate-sugar epimerase
MPGQISGPGWVIINPVGNLDVNVFKKIQRGEEIIIPNFGMETLHHVHADDVARVFFQAITNRNQALGESFHAVGEQSITLLGYAQALYRWFGHDERIKFLPWADWCDYTQDKDHIEKSYLHLMRSGYYSIEKAKRLIGYYPRYTLLETVFESVHYLAKHNWFEKPA